jgi:hypothetical protein
MKPYADEHTGLRAYLPDAPLPHGDDPRTWRVLVLAILLAGCFVLGFTTGQAYGAELGAENCIRSFDVRPGVMLRMQRYDVQARVRIEPHAHHRAFDVRYVSDVGGEGGSGRQLEGDQAAVTQAPLWWRGQPGGRYAFELTVYGSGGRALARRRVEIDAPDQEPSDGPR